MAQTKASIVTIHHIKNYGSVFQSYATLKALQSAGLDARLLDFRPVAATKSRLDILGQLKKSASHRLNAQLKNLLSGSAYSTQQARYEACREDWYQPISKTCHTDADLNEEIKNDKHLIAGSDQIWHPRSTLKTKAYLLASAHTDIRRSSYASSFGLRKIPAHLFEYYSTSLRNFDQISVREKSGVKLVEAMTGRKPDLVLDPTLMLTSDTWSAEASKPPSLSERPYILLYGHNSKSNYMENLGIYISRFTKWDVIRIDGRFYDAFSQNITYRFDIGPREWLWLMKNASLVLAQSFHGTAFAINFCVPFISILRGQVDHDARQSDFLKLLGMSKRSITLGDQFPASKDLLQEWSFDHPNSIIREKREESISFIKKLY